MNYNPNTPFESRKRVNEGFRTGLVGAITASLLHLILPFLAGGESWGDLVAWILQIFIYFFAANSAAESQYHKQEMDSDPYNGIQGAGVGAAMITSVITWVFILIRAIVINATGSMVIVEPFSLYCIIVVDVALALAIGSWRGSSVLKRHKI